MGDLSLDLEYIPIKFRESQEDFCIFFRAFNPLSLTLSPINREREKGDVKDFGCLHEKARFL